MTLKVLSILALVALVFSLTATADIIDDKYATRTTEAPTVATSTGATMATTAVSMTVPTTASTLTTTTEAPTVATSTGATMATTAVSMTVPTTASTLTTTTEAPTVAKSTGAAMAPGNSTEFNQLLQEYLKEVKELLKANDISFYAILKRTFNIKTVIHPYDILQVNQGDSFSLSSGVFTVPFNGTYFFYFGALKVKREFSGTLLIVQFVQKRNNVPNFRKVLNEFRMDIWEMFGWYPVYFAATASLQERDEVTVELIDGSIHETGAYFGGHLLSRYYG